MRPILRHLTTHVPREENIRITSNKTTLTTSVKHPVLVYRDDQLSYVRADEVRQSDALVQYRHRWGCDDDNWDKAWFAGAHLGDGSAYEKKYAYLPTSKAFVARAKIFGRRLIFKIRAAERGVVERYAAFFATFANSRAKMVQATTITWHYRLGLHGGEFRRESRRRIYRRADRQQVGQFASPTLDNRRAPAILSAVPGWFDRHRRYGHQRARQRFYRDEKSGICRRIEITSGASSASTPASSLTKPRTHFHNGHLVRGSRWRRPQDQRFGFSFRRRAHTWLTVAKSIAFGSTHLSQGNMTFFK